MRLAYFFATGCYIGLLPFSQGTFASVATCIGLGLVGAYGDLESAGMVAVILAAASFIGAYYVVAIAELHMQFLHGQRPNHRGVMVNRDYQQTVIDEIHGQAIAAVPAFAFAADTRSMVWLLVLSLVLFRIFDIAKPLVIGWIDKNVDGTTGIMLDDTVSGFAAAAIMHLSFVYGS